MTGINVLIAAIIALACMKAMLFWEERKRSRNNGHSRAARRERDWYGG